jgi:hypothetical protein
MAKIGISPGVTLGLILQLSARLPGGFCFLFRARDRSGNTGGFTSGKAEELERIARSPAGGGGCAHFRMEMLCNPYLTAQGRRG